MPGVVARTAAIFIPEISGKSFDSAAAMAPNAGLAPSTSQSGTSSKSERVSHSGNNRLKRALFLYSFASIRFDSSSRDPNGRKEVKVSITTKSLIAMARRRPTLLFAMICGRSIHDAPLVKAVDEIHRRTPHRAASAGKFSYTARSMTNAKAFSSTVVQPRRPDSSTRTRDPDRTDANTRTESISVTPDATTANST